LPDGTNENWACQVDLSNYVLMPLQKRQVLLLKSSGPMMFDLQSSRWDGTIFLMIPGTSCLATIVLSLRDKNHSPIEAPRIRSLAKRWLRKLHPGSSRLQGYHEIQSACFRQGKLRARTNFVYLRGSSFLPVGRRKMWLVLTSPCVLNFFFYFGL
jgi:hypothetical protein